MKRRFITAFLTMLSVTSLTACGLKFTTNIPSQAIEYTQTIDIASGEELVEIIDGMNFKDIDSIAESAGKIKEWARTYVEESKNLTRFQAAKLVRVVDGDTIVVDIENSEYKVRLIGVNTPESVASREYLEWTGKENTAEGEKASDFVKEILENVETVYLEEDVSNTDRFGRLLRYVWLEIPENDTDIEEISTKMLNGILVWEGVAEVATYAPDVARKEDFEYLAAYRDMELDN